MFRGRDIVRRFEEALELRVRHRIASHRVGGTFRGDVFLADEKGSWRDTDHLRAVDGIGPAGVEDSLAIDGGGFVGFQGQDQLVLQCEIDDDGVIVVPRCLQYQLPGFRGGSSSSASLRVWP